MKRLDREDIGVRIPGGDGFIGTLNVYHELHCLVCFPTMVSSTPELTLQKKRIHQHMYQDIYFQDLDDIQREMNRLHNGESAGNLRVNPLLTPLFRTLHRLPAPELYVPRRYRSDHIRVEPQR